MDLTTSGSVTAGKIPVPHRTTFGNYKWWVVAMLWLICFFNYADRQAIYSIFPTLGKEFGFDKFQLGLIGSAFMWVYAAGAPLAGFAGDQLRRKPLILGGCLFWSCITMLTGRCSRLWHFITVRGLEGVGETFYIPAATSLMSDYHGAETRSRALGIHNSSVYIGTIAGGWLGAWFAVHYGWRVGFYFFGAAGMVVALVLFRWLKEPVRGQAEAQGSAPSPNPLHEPVRTEIQSDSQAHPHPVRLPEGEGEPEAAPGWRETTRAVFRQPGAVLLLLAFTGANFVAAVFLTWTPTFLVEKFGFKLTAAGLSGSVFINLASALSVPVGGLLADRWAKRRAGGRILVQALGLALGVTFVFLVGWTNSVGLLLGTMAVFGACKGLYDSNIFASLFDYVEPRARGTAAGIMNTVGWSGGALAPTAIGWFSKHGRHATEMQNMSEAVSFCAVLYVISAILLLVAALKFPPRAEGPKLSLSTPLTRV